MYSFLLVFFAAMATLNGALAVLTTMNGDQPYFNRFLKLLFSFNGVGMVFAFALTLHTGWPQ